MVSADSFAAYDLVVICESGGSAKAEPYGKLGANFPKPTLCLEPYAPTKGADKWFGASGISSVKVTGSPTATAGLLKIKAADHEIFTGMGLALDDTVRWTTEKNGGEADADAHVRHVALDSLSTADPEITDNSTLLASNPCLEEDYGIDPAGFFWAIEKNTTLNDNRMVIMGIHANYLKGATQAFYDIIVNSAKWVSEIPLAGVKDFEANPVALNVFPNPVVNGRLNVQFNQKIAGSANIAIYDIAGKLVKNFAHIASTGINTVKVETNTLTSGLYFITVENSLGKSVQKFIVK